jgi:hypothetical protein
MRQSYNIKDKLEKIIMSTKKIIRDKIEKTNSTKKRIRKKKYRLKNNKDQI